MRSLINQEALSEKGQFLYVAMLQGVIQETIDANLHRHDFVFIHFLHFLTGKKLH